MLTEREMFEKSFERPTNYNQLPNQRQWDIDNALGILDWCGQDLDEYDIKRYYKHYEITKEHASTA